MSNAAGNSTQVTSTTIMLPPTAVEENRLWAIVKFCVDHVTDTKLVVTFELSRKERESGTTTLG